MSAAEAERLWDGVWNASPMLVAGLILLVVALFMPRKVK